MSIQNMSMWQPPDSYVKFQWDFRILCKELSSGSQVTPSWVNDQPYVSERPMYAPATALYLYLKWYTLFVCVFVCMYVHFYSIDLEN